MNIQRRTWLQAAGAASLVGSGAARAQAYPTKPVSWIVPWAAGGSADLTSRSIAAELGKVLGHTVTVENVPGGGGLVGLAKAANAPADGYTMYFGGSEMYVPAMTNPKITNDWTRQFKPVGRLFSHSMILATRADAPYNNIEEFTAYAKKNPGRVTYGSPGIATSQHIAGELMRDKGKIAIVHIPYRVGAQIVTDLLGGTIECAFLIGSTAQPHLKSGKLKALAIADSSRNPAFPGVSTFNESKTFVGISLNSFATAMVPFNTPDSVVERLSAAFKTTMFNDTVRAKFADIGAQIRYLPTTETMAFLKEDVLKNKRIIDFAKIKVNE
jgi:tripartite-type tricarboxylate transporter receptor subunit TctC